MTNEEFIKTVREYNSANGELNAGENNSKDITVFYQDTPILIIPFGAVSWFDLKFCSNDFDYYSLIKTKRFLEEKVQKLLDTPLRDRVPEKKYRLRWINDNDGTSTYLGIGTLSTWVFHTGKGNADVFTESEVQKLKEENPRFAKTIEIMKEPVGDN